MKFKVGDIVYSFWSYNRKMYAIVIDPTSTPLKDNEDVLVREFPDQGNGFLQPLAYTVRWNADSIKVSHYLTFINKYL